jgi:hypothetical protein
MFCLGVFVANDAKHVDAVRHYLATKIPKKGALNDSHYTSQHGHVYARATHTSPTQCSNVHHSMTVKDSCHMYLDSQPLTLFPLHIHTHSPSQLLRLRLGYSTPLHSTPPSSSHCPRLCITPSLQSIPFNPHLYYSLSPPMYLNNENQTCHMGGGAQTRCPTTVHRTRVKPPQTGQHACIKQHALANLAKRFRNTTRIRFLRRGGGVGKRGTKIPQFIQHLIPCFFCQGA